MDKPLLRRLLVLAATACAGLAGWRLWRAYGERRAEAALTAADEAMDRKEYPQALAALSGDLRALAKSRRYRALCLRAEALSALSRIPEASADLETARALDPSLWDAPYGLARLAMSGLQDCRGGLKTLDEALGKTGEVYWSKSKERASVFRLRWRCLQSLGDVEGAAADQGRELALRMESGETAGEEVRGILAARAWSNYLLYEKMAQRIAQGDWKQVYQERYGRSADAERGSVPPPASDPKSLAEAAPFAFLSQAESDATGALALREEPNLRLLRARIFVAAGKADAAAADLAAAPGMEGRAEYWLLRASIDGQRKSYKDALAWVERALSLEPANAEALRMRPMLEELLARVSASAPKPKRTRSPRSGAGARAR
ncbi:MAG TPA: hypothetical protein VNI01_15085 [Elusimicrobiota bacterium]|jgi:tetratricopeptide (TPR) repeat protein|nr:hypothetical protein [Elusimicrobiota bacterium]